MQCRTINPSLHFCLYSGRNAYHASGSSCSLGTIAGYAGGPVVCVTTTVVVAASPLATSSRTDVVVKGDTSS